jgi:hypothetical protein
MKRFLNKARPVNLEKYTSNGITRFRLLGSYNPSIVENELLIYDGKLFIFKSGDVYSFSYDSVTFDFLTSENTRINNAYTSLSSNITGITDIPTIPDEDGGIS